MARSVKEAMYVSLGRCGDGARGNGAGELVCRCSKFSSCEEGALGNARKALGGAVDFKLRPSLGDV